jgi:hypothetical protein
MTGVPPYVTVLVATPGSPESHAVLTAALAGRQTREHRDLDLIRVDISACIHAAAP